MDGRELKQLADSAGLGPVEICHEANISNPTLYKVYNDDHVRPSTKYRVEQAVRRLAAKAKQAVAG